MKRESDQAGGVTRTIKSAQKRGGRNESGKNLHLSGGLGGALLNIEERDKGVKNNTQHIHSTEKNRSGGGRLCAGLAVLHDKGQEGRREREEDGN